MRNVGVQKALQRGLQGFWWAIFGRPRMGWRGGRYRSGANIGRTGMP
jgi:hypothetical protein